ncbi:MAG: MlaD family protein [bacterium]
MKLSPELKVGIMVTVALTILGILIIVASGPYFFYKGYLIRVHFDYVSGLDAGAPVRLAGMEVGEVKDLKLVNEKIEVTLKLNHTAQIRSDSQVTINSLGIVGEKYVEITRGTHQGKILKSESVIQGINPVNVEEMLNRTEAVVYKSEKIVAFMDKMLGGEELWVEFDKIIKNIFIFTITLNELVVENKDELNSTIKDLHAICASLKKIIKENSEDVKITTEKLKQTTIQLNKTVENINNTVLGTKKDITNTFTELSQTIVSLQNILEKVEKGEGSLGKLLADEEIANRLTNASKNIEELTLDLKKHPWKLLQKGGTTK